PLLPPPAPPSTTLFPYTTLFRSYCWIGYTTIPSFRSKSRVYYIYRLIVSVTNYPSKIVSCGIIGQCNGSLVKIFIHTEPGRSIRSEEHTSELQSRENLVCRLLLE